MYREVFARGLRSVKAFYVAQGVIKNDGSEEEKGA